MILFVLPLAVTTPAQEGRILRIGSKTFTENRILAWIVHHMLTDAGFRVFYQSDSETTFELREMLTTGEIDIYVEYTGTGVLHLHEQFGEERIDFDAGYDPQLAFITVSTFDSANNDLTWLPPAPGNNTYALAVMETFAEENSLTTVEDLANYINAGNEVTLVGGEEFIVRLDGLPAFESFYDFTLLDSQKISIPDGTPQDTLPALLRGEDGANVGMAYLTAAELLLGDYVILEDNLNAQFVYQPSPVIRGEIVRQFPEIVEILTPVFIALDNRALQDLNLAVAEFEDTPEEAALNFLVDRGFIELDPLTPTPEPILCEVQRPDSTIDANLRDAPGLDAQIVGSLASGVQLPVIAQTTDSEGFVWWQLGISESPWIREDTVEELGNCAQVPESGG